MSRATSSFDIWDFSFIDPLRDETTRAGLSSIHSLYGAFFGAPHAIWPFVDYHALKELSRWSPLREPPDEMS
jgi:hypothetical protein